MRNLLRWLANRLPYVKGHMASYRLLAARVAELERDNVNRSNTGYQSGLADSLAEYEYLKPCLPAYKIDYNRNIYYDAIEYMKKNNVSSVLDLGCGTGELYELCKEKIPTASYIGLDVVLDEVLSEEGRFLQYDGVNIPLKTGSQELIVSRQVLEHVRYPYEMLRDASRVLTSNGLFMGSTAGLEPLHGKSIFNYTPFGLKYVFEKTGFKLRLLYPGIAVDGTMKAYLSQFLGESPIYSYESEIYTILEKELTKPEIQDEYVNFAKLAFAGCIKFIAEKA